VRFFYSDNYVFPLPVWHPFPIEKYSDVATALKTAGLADETNMIDPGLVSEADLLLVHEPDYIGAFKSGSLDPLVLRKIGFPWSEKFVRRSHAAVAGTIAAAEAAIKYGIAFNLAGGTHHAFPSRGEGYCVFNDVAVAVRKLQGLWRKESSDSDGSISSAKRVAIIDLDAHQGNGTNFILGEDPSAYTFSMHVGSNFPSKKCSGTEDIALDKGVTGDLYLSLLKERLPDILDSFKPSLVFYVAGVDVHKDDRFGQMGLTTAEVEERDSFTIGEVVRRGIALAIVMGGGYNKDRALTSQLHLATAKIAAAI
jgi:acetoin utilization deacetylase AcuC-like enzyme